MAYSGTSRDTTIDVCFAGQTEAAGGLWRSECLLFLALEKDALDAVDVLVLYMIPLMVTKNSRLQPLALESCKSSIADR